MANYIDKPISPDVVRLCGRISGYKVERASASFFFTRSDQTEMGVIAIASAAVGMAGQAAIMANHASSLEEEADFVEFYLDEKEVKGWLWKSPFADGDEVIVAAELRGAYYEVFGIARPLDKVIALYPHCSRGTRSHLTNALKWYGYLLVFIMMCVGFLGFMDDGKPFGFWLEMLADPYLRFLPIAFVGIFSVMSGVLALKWMPFVRLCEQVLHVLGVSHPSRTDLVKSTKMLRTLQDPPECGYMYFKY